MIREGGLVLLVVLVVAACGGPPATPAPVAAPAGQRLTIVAADFAFEPATLRAAPGVPLHIAFENHDRDVPHDLGVYAGPGFATELAKTDIVVGPATLDLEIPGLVAGAYEFRCTVHPTMTGQLRIGG